MSRHARLNEFENTRRYTDRYHDGLVALWREQYEEALRTGAPAPNLPPEVEAAVIHSARRMRSQVIADVLSGGIRRLAGLLTNILRAG